MVKIVKANRRYSNWSRGQNPKAWTVIAEFEAKSVKADFGPIPAHIDALWDQFKSPLGYASFYGLDPKNSIRIYELAKGGSISLAIDRWGRVSGWKIK